MNKSEKKVKKKIGFCGYLSRLTAIVMFAVLISCTLVSSLFARYLGGGEQASSTRVARYYVNATVTSGQDSTLQLNNNNKLVYFSIEIVNFNGNDVSEVAIEYSLILTLSDKMSNVTVKLCDGDGKEVSATKETSDDGKTITYGNVGEFAAAVKETHTRKLAFSFVNEIETYEVFNFNVSIVASQKD